MHWKVRATTVAVITDSMMILKNSFQCIPWVHARKRGTDPIASTATNSGTKHIQKRIILQFSSSCFIIESIREFSLIPQIREL
jgi:hypothetical protein